MQTYQITKKEIEGLEVLAEGYKAIKWDSSTKGNSSFSYGKENDVLVGTVWEVDEEIKKCKWGLHFSKDPANVFSFYEPLGYNRYFKVKAYKGIRDNETEKTVAQCIEFVEEYDLSQFICIIKSFDRNDTTVNRIYGVTSGNAVSSSNAVIRSKAINNSCAINNGYAVTDSNAVVWSSAVSGSIAISDSHAINNSYTVHYSNAVHDSNAVSCSIAINNGYAIKWSNTVSNSYAVNRSNTVSCSKAISDSDVVSVSTAVNWSNTVSNSYAVNQSNTVSWSFGVKECEAVKGCVFCFKKEGAKNYIFNKKVKEERLKEVFAQIRKFNYVPKYMNWNEIKGNKKWWAFNFEKLRGNENPWSDMPKGMIDYLKSLPEYNAKVFKAITGLEG